MFFRKKQGEVLEWLKRHAWKACNRQNRFAGSNPVLSAVNADNQQLTNFTHVNTHTFRGLRAYFFSQYLYYPLSRDKGTIFL